MKNCGTTLILIEVLSVINVLTGQDVTTELPTEDTGSDDAIYPMSLIAVGVLGGAIVIGIGVAKLVDVIHDRQSLRDDASDMSEYTRNLLKARLTISAFKSAVDKDKDKEKERNPEESARKVFRLWSAKTIIRAKRKDLAKKGTDAEGESGEVAKPEAELKGYKQTGGDGVFMVSPAAMEAGAAPAQPPVTQREKGGLLPQLTVITEQRDHEDQEEPVDEHRSEGDENSRQGGAGREGENSEPPTGKERSRENTTTSVNSKIEDEKQKSRKTSVTTVAEIDAIKPTESPAPDTLQNSYIGYRGESEDLMIPVSTDEPPRAKTPVSALKSKENSAEEYDFLKGEGNKNDGDETARDVPSQSTNRSASQITLERMDTRSSLASEAGAHTTGSKASRPGTGKAPGPLSRGSSQAVIPTNTPGMSRPNSAVVRPKTPGTSRKTSTVSPRPGSSRPKTPAGMGERGKSQSNLSKGLKRTGSTISNTKL